MQTDVISGDQYSSLSGAFWIKSVPLFCLVSEASYISSYLFPTAFAFVEMSLLHWRDPRGSALYMDFLTGFFFFFDGVEGDIRHLGSNV